MRPTQWLPSELTIWSGGQPGGVTTGWDTSSAGNARAALMDRTLERAFQNDLSGEVTSEQGHKGRASQAEGRHLPGLCGRSEGRSPEEDPSPPHGCPTGLSDSTQPPPGSRLPQPAAPSTSPMSGAGGGHPAPLSSPSTPHPPASRPLVSTSRLQQLPAHPGPGLPGSHLHRCWSLKEMPPCLRPPPIPATLILESTVVSPLLGGGLWLFPLCPWQRRAVVQRRDSQGCAGAWPGQRNLSEPPFPQPSPVVGNKQYQLHRVWDEG